MKINIEATSQIDSRGGYQAIIKVNKLTIWTDDVRYETTDEAEFAAYAHFTKRIVYLFG